MANHLARQDMNDERDELVEAIDEISILQLASSYHGGDECDFFRNKVRGSCNINYFVRFENNDSWVVRIPLQPCLVYDVQFKIRREVAVLKLLADRTTIPIPRIIGHSLGRKTRPGPPSYLILEYIRGTQLSFTSFGRMDPRRRIYLLEQLADMYVQLRRLTFSSIGALGLTRAEGPTVVQGPISREFNEQHLEGTVPSRERDFRGPQGIHYSASEYAHSLVGMVRNRFEESPSNIEDEKDAMEKLYYLCQFEETVSRWVDQSLDQGPFVLAHGNLFQHNIFVDENMNLKAITNWQWARVVPLQFFNPPRWLVTNQIRVIAWKHNYRDHIEKLDYIRDAVRRIELERYGSTTLWDEWSNIDRDGALLIAAALEEVDLDSVLAIGYRYQDEGNTPTTRIQEFIARNSANRDLVAKKVSDRAEYDERCKERRLDRYAPIPMDRVPASAGVPPMLPTYVWTTGPPMVDDSA